MSGASSYPPDVQAILARKDAEIAAARKVRQGLSGKRDWKNPAYSVHGFGRGRLDPEERPITECERGIIRCTLANGPTLARDIADETGFSNQAVQGCLPTLVAKLRSHGVRCDLVTIGMDTRRRLMIVDAEAARALM